MTSSYRVQDGSEENTVWLVGNSFENDFDVPVQKTRLNEELCLLSEWLWDLGVIFALESWALRDGKWIGQLFECPANERVTFVSYLDAWELKSDVLVGRKKQDSVGASISHVLNDG